MPRDGFWLARLAIKTRYEFKEKRRNLRNTATPQEIILWNQLKSKGLGAKFRRQHSIGKYIVDFCCPVRRLIVEIDGSQHGEEDAERYDTKRTQYLQDLGYTVLRFWNNEVNTNLSIRSLDEHYGNTKSHHPLTPPHPRRGGRSRESRFSLSWRKRRKSPPTPSGGFLEAFL